MWQQLNRIFCLRQTCLLLLSSILLSACMEGESNDTGTYDALEKPIIPLKVASVREQKIPRYYSATGYTNIARTIQVSTSQSGNIRALKVNEGDTVKAGALLIVIDESELLTSIKQAKAAIRSAQINFNDRQQDFNTSKRLSQSKVIPAEQLRKARVQLNLANSQLVQTKSQLKRLQARKPYYRITSPIAARVVKRWVNQGGLAVVGKPLLQLEAITGVEFETALPAMWIDQVHVGNSYTLYLDHTQEHIKATVSHVIHSTNRITQTCQIKLSLPDLSDISSLSAGLSGKIDFVIAQENQVVVPESSLVKKAGVQGVFRLNKNHKAYFTPVKTERSWQQQRVILAGLKQGESVVLEPPSNLLDGSKIKVLLHNK